MKTHLRLVYVLFVMSLALRVHCEVITPVEPVDFKNITWGPATNGVRAGICASKHGPCVLVFFERFPSSEPKTPQTTNSGGHSTGWIVGNYFWPTNTIRIPVMVSTREDSERPIEPLVAAATNLVDFPPTMNLMEVRFTFESKYTVYSGPDFPPRPVSMKTGPHVGTWAPAAYIPLAGLFQLKTNQEYRVSIYPKLYKRVFTNSDICTRIDLPPLTTAITTRAK